MDGLMIRSASPSDETNDPSARPPVQVTESDLERLAAALARLLLVWWQRREKERPPVDDPRGREKGQ
jgi:hypothetical protein